MQLTDYLKGVSAKTLSAVEVDRRASNQHEFNGTVAMRGYLGVDRREIPARFIRVDADDEFLIEDFGGITWYDARDAHPTRSEHRLYFRDNLVMALAEVGDVLITALLPDDKMLVLVVSAGSRDLLDLLWFFGLSRIPGRSFETPDDLEGNDRSFAVCSMIADRIGFEVPDHGGDRWVDFLVRRFGGIYPTTREFSAAARETLGDLDVLADPDLALVTCMDREEEMFRQYERHLLGVELRSRVERWVNDVDDFVSFSLSVQNRRKARAGSAFENHVEWVLASCALRFERGVTTEERSRPDFLFPGQRDYLDPGFPTEKLGMLGVKTSCKDRWRQVLNEAARIRLKHLLTLDPAITADQIAEMNRSSVELVVPRTISSAYSHSAGRRVMGVRAFVDQFQALQAGDKGSLL